MMQELTKDDLQTVLNLMAQVQHLDAEITYMQVSRQGRNLGSIRNNRGDWAFTPAEKPNSGDYYGR